jgi:putative DNA primase/helicase
MPAFQKPKTYCVPDLAQLPVALKPLLKLQRWVVWRWVWKASKDKDKGKWTKPPYQPRNPGQLAENNNSKTWATFEEAVAVVKAGRADGIGFNLLDSDYGAIDLDKCRDPESGVVEDWAQKIIDSAPADAYVEVTVSGTGFRIIGTTDGEALHKKPGKFEVYRSCARYITVSGLALEGRGDRPLPNIDTLLDELAADRGPKKRGPGRPTGSKTKKELPGYLTTILLLPDKGAGQPTGAYATRSDALFAFNRLALDRHGLDENDIIAAVLDDKYKGCAVYEHCLDNGGEDYLKRQIERAANYVDESGNKRIIKLVGGEKHRIWRETQEALIAAGCQVFVRGERLVEPLWRVEEDKEKDRSILAMKFVQYNLARLEDQVARHAVEFFRYNKTDKKWLAVDPPTDVITALLTRGDWKFDSVIGITNTPTLRRDGSLLDTPGYDRASKLWYKPVPGFCLPPISDNPTVEDAKAALELLKGLINEFPFVDDGVEGVSRSVALAGMLTAVLRGAFRVAPMFLFRKPDAGTGGSYLVEVISVLATGRPAPPLKVSDDKNELQKELSAAACEARPILNLNNITFNVKSSDLAQIVTEGTMLIRPFGKNDELRLVDCSAMTIFINGNNIVVVGELVRRTMTAHLNAKLENPETRKFTHRPVEEVAAERGKYLAAVFTIARAYAAAGKPEVEAETLNGLEEWSAAIRYPLIWLGLPDPAECLKEARALDPERGEKGARISALVEVFGAGESGNEFTAGDVLKKMQEIGGSGPYGRPEPRYPDLVEAFAIASGSGVPMNSKAIGNTLIENLDKVINDYRIVMIKKDSHHGHRYKLIGKDYDPGAWRGEEPPAEKKPQTADRSIIDEVPPQPARMEKAIEEEARRRASARKKKG